MKLLFAFLIGIVVGAASLIVYFVPINDHDGCTCFSNRLQLVEGISTHEDFKAAICDKVVTQSIMNSNALDDASKPYLCFKVGHWIYCFTNENILLKTVFHDSLGYPEISP